MSERQQLATAIRTAALRSENRDDPLAIARAVEPFLVAAERAGYERGRGDSYRSGKSDGQRIGYADAMRQHGLIEHESPETYEDGARDGYERCKRDATKGIGALIVLHTGGHDDRWQEAEYNGAIEAALAVVAALNATQQEASDD